MAEENTNIIQFVNRKAKYQYTFLAHFEAGIMLTGTEIKSIRGGHVNLKDAFCNFIKGELFIRNLYIKEYKFGTYFNHESRRPRKLLLKRSELRKLERKVKERGFSIIPYQLYINDKGIAKVEIVLTQGKKSFDKRQSIKEKDQKRDLARMKKLR